MPRLDDAIASLRAALPELRRDFGVEGISVYGSVARGESRPESDIDLLIAFSPGSRPTLFTLVRLQAALEVRLGCPVDLTTAGGLRRRMRDTVLREAVRVA